MKTANRLIVFTVFMLALGAKSPAFASEDVQFNSAGVPLTPFQVKRAKAKGIELKPEPGILLAGRLSRPQGAGPFPAVVLMHSCFGIRPHQDRWASDIADWGYVALQVDSFGPRGIVETCTDLNAAFYAGVGTSNVLDAYGALSYLRGLPFADGDRVAIMGWGFSPIMSAVVRDGQQRYFEEKFRAAVALYPDCDNMTSGDFYLPLTIHIGDLDDWNLAAVCERTAAASKGLANPVNLHIHPGVRHGFDDAELGSLWIHETAQNVHKTPPRGATLGYDRDAYRVTQQQVRAFLDEHLR